MKYNWQHPKWPLFTYNESKIKEIVLEYLFEAGLTLGLFQGFDKDLETTTLQEILIEEALTTSKIEGEDLTYDDLRSSFSNQLGLETFYPSKDPRADGLSKMMMDLRRNFKEPLTSRTLWNWHEMMFQNQRLSQDMEVGKWRTDPFDMEIISGPYGKEKVFFKAPKSQNIPSEMDRFIKWYNDFCDEKDHVKGVLRAALCHLYFESIHPFVDGNGRIGRALSEKALSQDLGYGVLMSLSKQLHKEKKTYYGELHKASSYTLDVTNWIVFFSQMILKAQKDAKETLIFVMKKSKFWKTYGTCLNDRQEKVLKRLFKEGKEGFKGGLSAKNHMTITQCSKATATRDLADLLKKGCLVKSQTEGRSTCYFLNLSP
ncbi:MAG TPA: Fic family protein [Alphaproteobacteria bacterium]|nr:Fic family protein [Alphaproteobacteria bacterium]